MPGDTVATSGRPPPPPPPLFDSGLLDSCRFCLQHPSQSFVPMRPLPSAAAELADSEWARLFEAATGQPLAADGGHSAWACCDCEQRMRVAAETRTALLRVQLQWRQILLTLAQSQGRRASSAPGPADAMGYDVSPQSVTAETKRLRSDKEHDDTEVANTNEAIRIKTDISSDEEPTNQQTHENEGRLSMGCAANDTSTEDRTAIQLRIKSEEEYEGHMSMLGIDVKETCFIDLGVLLGDNRDQQRVGVKRRSGDDDNDDTELTNANEAFHRRQIKSEIRSDDMEPATLDEQQTEPEIDVKETSSIDLGVFYGDHPDDRQQVGANVSSRGQIKRDISSDEDTMTFLDEGRPDQLTDDDGEAPETCSIDLEELSEDQQQVKVSMHFDSFNADTVENRSSYSRLMSQHSIDDGQSQEARCTLRIKHCTKDHTRSASVAARVAPSLGELAASTGDPQPIAGPSRSSSHRNKDERLPICDGVRRVYDVGEELQYMYCTMQMGHGKRFGSQLMLFTVEEKQLYCRANICKGLHIWKCALADSDRPCKVQMGVRACDKRALRIGSHLEHNHCEQDRRSVVCLRLLRYKKRTK